MDAPASSRSVSRKRRRDDSNGEMEEGDAAVKFKRHTVVKSEIVSEREREAERDGSCV